MAGTAGRDISSGLNYFLVFALPEHPALSSYSLTKGRAGRGGALLCHSCCYAYVTLWPSLMLSVCLPDAGKFRGQQQQCSSVPALDETQEEAFWKLAMKIKNIWLASLKADMRENEVISYRYVLKVNVYAVWKLGRWDHFWLYGKDVYDASNSRVGHILSWVISEDW